MKENDARKLPKALQQELRKRAVIAVKRGRSKTLVAECLGVSRKIVALWCAKAETYGIESLEGDKRGLPIGITGKINIKQKQHIIKQIINSLPDTLGLPTQLWTRKAVRALIKRQYNVTYNLTSISRLLNSNGLTPQKPIYKALQRSTFAINNWLEYEYPKIKERAETEGAEIHWEDEMGVRSDDIFGRSYGLRNRTPVVNKCSNKYGCNMISTITNSGSMRFMIYHENFTVKIFINFLKRLLHKQKKKTFLILDNHSVHHAKNVKQWAYQNKERIEFFFLPAYAPELNPDELLNRNVKSNVVYSNLFNSQEELKSKLRRHLFSLQTKKEIIKSFFKSKEVQYAA